MNKRTLGAVYDYNGNYYLYIKELQDTEHEEVINLVMCKGIIVNTLSITELRDNAKEYLDKKTFKKIGDIHNAFIKTMISDKSLPDSAKDKAKNVLLTDY